MKLIKPIVFAGLLFALTACKTSHVEQASIPAPTLLSVEKIWDKGNHNAFTDLIRYNGKWFCTFREAEKHVGGVDGTIRVLISDDGKTWQSAALLSEEGVDLRDPKLSITPDKRLMLVLGGSVYEGKTLKERQPRVAFSKNGKNWSVPQRVAEKGDWIWRVTWHKGRAYGISYGGGKIKLLVSDDGMDYRLLTSLEVPDYPNEATVRFLKNGDCVALLRREAQDKQAWIGRSSAPYKDWQWQPAGMQIGGPNFIVLDDGAMIASGRQYRNANWNESKTFVGRMDLQSVRADLILPSGGDCSYPGMVLHKGELWVSYYSSHEGKSSIYLARVLVSP
ncbi:MAG: exo-alpha-sialidase [Verrucomicrobia bacterium]|nr:exo-alpha-sialidase [Verrucomicrobiota bacterium]